MRFLRLCLYILSLKEISRKFIYIECLLMLISKCRILNIQGYYQNRLVEFCFVKIVGLLAGGSGGRQASPSQGSYTKMYEVQCRNSRKDKRLMVCSYNQKFCGNISIFARKISEANIVFEGSELVFQVDNCRCFGLYDIFVSIW